MKIKIITTEDEQWLVLSPEGKFEKEVLDMFDEMPNCFRSEFAESQGGYLREYKVPTDLIIKFPKEKTQIANP